MPGQFELFQDDAGQARWRLKADNGEIIAASEGYSSLTAALRGIEAVRRLAPDATTEDLT